MTVLATAISTKSGKRELAVQKDIDFSNQICIAIISRQFKQLTRSRVEGLLNTFPKLIPAGSQHTTVETDNIRFVYQPLDELYLVLITNKGSNILQDIESLNLFSRITTDILRNLNEECVNRYAFDLLVAWDEIISNGYRDNNNFLQIKTLLEMESHEEKIQEIIAKNKEMEAKEELKRRARQLELQRREAARLGSNTGISLGKYSSSSEINIQPSISPSPSTPTLSEQSSSQNQSKPSFKGSGMKLGKKPVNKSIIDSMIGE